MPIRVDDWMIFHCPKTGGSTLHQAAMQAGGWRVGGGHDLLVHHRHEAAQHRLAGTIRDPWTRYGSLYNHARLRARREHDLELWGNGCGSFRRALYGWTHPAEVEQIPREVGVIWSPGRAERLLQHGTGLYSWELHQVYGGRMDALLATDRLAEAIPEVFGFPMLEHRNRGAELDYRAWYDDEMIGWVAEAEAGLIERFGWEPWTVSVRPAWYPRVRTERLRLS